MDYREADKVSLHDEGILLRRNFYPDCIVGWKEYEEDGKPIHIKGEALAAILETLGLPNEGFSSIHYDKGGNAKKHFYCIKDHDLPIFAPECSEPTNGWTVQKILARVDAGRLDLKLFISSTWEDDDKSKKMDFQNIDITYSGKFTIWWKINMDNCVTIEEKYVTPEILAKVYQEYLEKFERPL